MNIRQRKVAILREMKALKREYNRLSSTRHKHSRRRIYEDKYESGSRSMGSMELRNYYYDLGRKHGHDKRDTLKSNNASYYLGHDVGTSIMNDVVSNDFSIFSKDMPVMFKDRYMNGLQDGMNDQSPGNGYNINPSILVGIRHAFNEYTKHAMPPRPHWHKI